MSECFKCGADIRDHTSAYNPWDEAFVLNWIPASDSDHVIESDSGGVHPETATRRFCSRDCLESFIQMDYRIRGRAKLETDGGTQVERDSGHPVIGECIDCGAFYFDLRRIATRCKIDDCGGYITGRTYSEYRAKLETRVSKGGDADGGGE